LQASAKIAVIGSMSTKSREVIWGGQIMGEKIHAKRAREQAQKSAREADRAEAHTWSIQMEGYGGPAQPSPTIGHCIHGGLVVGDRVQSLQDSRPAAGCHPPAARHADLEAGSIAEMPVKP
jgi:hypothetical protein